MNRISTRSLVLSIGLLLGGGSTIAAATEEGPPGPSVSAPRPASAAAPKAASAAAKPAPAGKPGAGAKAAAAAKPAAGAKAATGAKATATKGPAEAAPPLQGGSEPPTAKRSVPLKLAPSAAEIESERNSPGGIPAPPPEKRDPRDGTPKQNDRWPTHVDYTRGPGSPLGAGTAGDRKGTMEEASGPQTGVIRNRW